MFANWAKGVSKLTSATHMLSNKTTRVILALIISAILLWLAVRKVDFVSAWGYAGSFNVGLMLLALSIWLFDYVLRGFRWLIFLNNLHPVRWLESFRVLMIGFAMNNVLPLRAGEFVRAYLLHRRVPEISTSSAFATVAGERLFDGIAVTAFAILGSFSLPLPDWASRAIMVAGVLFAVAFGGFLAMAFYPGHARSMVSLLSQRLPEGIRDRINRTMSRFIVGLEVLRSKRSIAALLASSLVIWSLEVVFYYISARSFGIELSFWNASFVMGILNLAILVPSAPGGIGAVEFAVVQSLLILGISESLSFSYALVSHVITNGSVVLIGFYFLWRIGTKIESGDLRVENEKP